MRGLLPRWRQTAQDIAENKRVLSLHLLFSVGVNAAPVLIAAYLSAAGHSAFAASLARTAYQLARGAGTLRVPPTP